METLANVPERLPSPRPTKTVREGLDQVVALFRRTVRYWRPAATVFAIGAAISVAVAFLKPRTYMSETAILYREGIRSSDLGQQESGGHDPARKLGLRLKEMVLSRTRLQQIIEEFKLYRDLIESRGGYVEAVDEMRKHIAFRVKDGDTFGLSFEGEGKDLVQQITARLAEVLIEENSKSRSEQAEVTLQFLDAQVKQAEQELRQREVAQAQFLAKHPEFAMDAALQSGAGGASGGSVGVSIRTADRRTPRAQDPALLALEREALRIQARLGMPIKKSELALDPKLAAERTEGELALAAAQKDLAERQGQFTEQHPDVQAAKARVTIAETKLKRILERATQAQNDAADALATQASQTAPEDRSTLQTKLQKVRGEISAYKAKQGQSTEGQGGSSWIVALETEWARLTREANDTRAKYQSLESKKFQAALSAESVTTGNNAQMVVIDPAYKPEHPVKAGRTVITLIGWGAALFIAGLVALGGALFDERVYSRDDVERLAVGRLLVVVPREKKKFKRQDMDRDARGGNG